MNPLFILRSFLRAYKDDVLEQENLGVAMSNQFSSRSWRKWVLALCVAMLACSSAASIADDDHDRARQALEAGEVLPLHVILVRVEREQLGQVLDVELEREHEGNRDRWVYKIKMLRSGGALVKLKVDAHDGAIISQKNKGGHDGENGQKKIQRSGEGR